MQALKVAPFLSLLGAVAAQSSNADSCTTVSDRLDLLSENDYPLAVSGEDAYNCLLDVPFYTDLGSEYLKEVRKYIEFQSTIEILKNPPDSYVSSAVDLISGLDKIADTVYDSQYEFDEALNNLVSSANDGHFYIQSCTSAIFTFSREEGELVSISEDGLKTPEIYTKHDAKIIANSKSSGSVSPVAKVNDEPVKDFIEKLVKSWGLQDPDARWNSAFSSPTTNGSFINNLGRYPGSNTTTLEFKNGSSIDITTVAAYNGQKWGVYGSDVFSLWCDNRPVDLAPPIPEDDPDDPFFDPLEEFFNAADDEPIEGPQGYPKPFIRDTYNQMVGYHLDDDTSVMLIPTFSTEANQPTNYSIEVANVATQLIEESKASGRTKLIIDVTGNPGGNIARAFDLFKLFFPDETPYSATRFRRHDAADLIATVLGDLDYTDAQDQPLSWKGKVTPDQEKDAFSSLDDLLGDEEQLGVAVSSLYANFNFSAISDTDPLTDPVRGYGALEEYLNKTAPYKAEDILIVGNGDCSSTCTTFTNLMSNVAGVRTLAFGGRPQTGAMQLMGGVRGAQAATWDLIFTWVGASYQQLEATVDSNGDYTLLTPEQFVTANDTVPLNRTTFPIPANGGVNFRNAYQDGNDDLPLQFAYQAADCRLFYTAENVVDPSTTWTSAKKAIWGGGECVEKSTGGKGSVEYKKDHPDEESGSEANGSEDEEDAAMSLQHGSLPAIGLAIVAGLFVML